MQFELHITCTKDLEELKINFSDGSVIATEKNDGGVQKSPPKQYEPKEPKEMTKSQHRKQRSDSFLDVDADFSSISHDVVQKPIIDRGDKPVKVAQELQNFNF